MQIEEWEMRGIGVIHLSPDITLLGWHLLTPPDFFWARKPPPTTISGTTTRPPSTYLGNEHAQPRQSPTTLENEHTRSFSLLLVPPHHNATQRVDDTTRTSMRKLIRRVDTRMPTPLLSTYIANMAHAPSLGKLVDLRAVRGPSVPSPFGVGVSGGGPGAVRSTSPSNANSWRAAPPSSLGRSTTPVGGQRGWAVVAKSPSPEGNQSSLMPLRSEKPQLPAQAAGSSLGLAGRKRLLRNRSLMTGRKINPV